MWKVLVAVGLVAVIPGGSASSTSAQEEPVSSTSVNPRRLLDTRPGAATFDGQFAGGGAVEAGETIQVQIAGRINETIGARTAMLNVTVTEPTQAGYLMVFPCDVPRPLASSVNYGPSQTVANLVSTRLDAGGEVCVFSLATAHVIVDGATTLDSSMVALPAPRRLMDTRPGQLTIDGEFAGDGVLAARAEIRLDVAGRGGVSDTASAVLLNVTITNPRSPGFVTVHACDTDLPDTSNVNYAAGATVANMVISRLDSSGAVCIYSLATADVIVDVSGELVDGYTLLPAPVRIVDTRVDELTPLTLMGEAGKVPAGWTTGISLDVGDPVDRRRIAVFNVTAIEPAAPGFLTVHSGRVRPTASNLGYGPSTPAVANLVMIPVNNLGEYTCIYTSADAYLAADFVGFIDAELTAPSTGGCPRDLAQIPPEPGGPMFNDREISFGEALTITPLVVDEYGIHLEQPVLNQLATQICNDFDAGVAARDIVMRLADTLTEIRPPDDDRARDAALDLIPYLATSACQDLARNALDG